MERTGKGFSDFRISACDFGPGVLQGDRRFECASRAETSIEKQRVDRCVHVWTFGVWLAVYAKEKCQLTL